MRCGRPNHRSGGVVGIGRYGRGADRTPTGERGDSIESVCILFSFGRFDLRVGAEGPWLFRASCVHAYMVMPAVLRIRYVCLKSKIIIRKYAHIRHMIPFASIAILSYVSLS
jgi:hypothetical protein